MGGVVYASLVGGTYSLKARTKWRNETGTVVERLASYEEDIGYRKLNEGGRVFGRGTEEDSLKLLDESKDHLITTETTMDDIKSEDETTSNS